MLQIHPIDDPSDKGENRATYELNQAAKFV